VVQARVWHYACAQGSGCALQLGYVRALLGAAVARREGTIGGSSGKACPVSPVVAQGAAAALRTRPLPQPTSSSLVVESCFLPYLLHPHADCIRTSTRHQTQRECGGHCRDYCHKLRC
jgi:hypothetical protein